MGGLSRHVNALMALFATDEHGFSRIIAKGCLEPRMDTNNRKVDVGAISAFNFLQSTLYGMDAIATNGHEPSGLSRFLWVGRSLQLLQQRQKTRRFERIHMVKSVAIRVNPWPASGFPELRLWRQWWRLRRTKGGGQLGDL